MLHTSSSFKDAFKKEFGNKGVPAAVTTRWNSQLRQIKSKLALDAKKLSDVCEAGGHKNLIINAREWGQLAELAEILDPFLEATLLTEVERIATISHVLPSVLALRSHLSDVLKQHNLKFCAPVAKALLASLNTRFHGMLIRCKLDNSQGMLDVTDLNSLPFGSDIYFIAAFFDPQFRMNWIDKELTMNANERGNFRQEVRG